MSFDPWGWAPYHYGRWAFVARIGWCWVPPAAGDVYWGPGYVGWVGTGDYVGWVPLAPGEIYYGRGYYGRHSVNVTNINITEVHVTNVYKNVYVNNGPTIVERRTFASSSPKIMRMQPNVIQRQVFAKNNLSAGTPFIKPTKESYFASAKRIPAAKLPPQPVRKIDVKQLKESRPFVKAPERSVIKPGTKPGSLPLQSVRTPKTPGKEKPAIQRITPSERGAPGIPGRGPAPQQEVKPLERRTFQPERGVQPQKEIKPQERRVVPPAQPQKEVKPQERRVVPPERGAQPQKEIKPEKKPAPSERGAAPGKEKKTAEPKKEEQKKDQKEEEQVR